MSHHANYIREREGKLVEEFKDGFIIYSYIDNGRQVFIHDIYVAPEKRKTGLATTMANAIVEKAKTKDAQELVGAVDITALNATESLKFQLAYGMKLFEIRGNLIVLGMEI